MTQKAVLGTGAVAVVAVFGYSAKAAMGPPDPRRQVMAAVAEVVAAVVAPQTLNLLAVAVMLAVAAEVAVGVAIPVQVVLAGQVLSELFGQAPLASHAPIRQQTPETFDESLHPTKKWAAV